jgi:probable F420-dependent oxidoreductase
MLELARRRACGAYPYLVTPSYVSGARAAVGEDSLLAVLLMIIPATDREQVRRVAAEPLNFLARAGGYRPNLLRQGFTETDIDQVSDRLLDGVTAWGDERAIAERVAAYRAASADQVVLRILGVDDVALWRRRLAGTLFS